MICILLLLSAPWTRSGNLMQMRRIFRLICLKPVCPACFYCAAEGLWCHQVIAPLELQRFGFRASPWWPAQLSTLPASIQIAGIISYEWGERTQLIHRHFWAPRGVRSNKVRYVLHVQCWSDGSGWRTDLCATRLNEILVLYPACGQFK